MTLSDKFRFTKLLGNTAAGTDTAEVVASAVDARGFDRALFILQVGAVTATGALKFNVQECSDSGGTYADIPGANLGETGVVLTGKSDHEIMVDVPVREGYLKAKYQRTTANIEFDALDVLLYSSKALPANGRTTLLKEVIV